MSDVTILASGFKCQSILTHGKPNKVRPIIIKKSFPVINVHLYIPYSGKVWRALHLVN